MSFHGSYVIIGLSEREKSGDSKNIIISTCLYSNISSKVVLKICLGAVVEAILLTSKLSYVICCWEEQRGE